MAERAVRRRRTIKIGDARYRVGKKATRTASVEGNTKTVTLAKAGGGAVVKTLTKSDDAKNTRIGAYARANKTVNEDGSVTYAKKGGGTVTKTLSVSGEPKTKRRRSS